MHVCVCCSRKRRGRLALIVTNQSAQRKREADSRVAWEGSHARLVCMFFSYTHRVARVGGQSATHSNGLPLSAHEWRVFVSVPHECDKWSDRLVEHTTALPPLEWYKSLAVALCEHYYLIIRMWFTMHSRLYLSVLPGVPSMTYDLGYVVQSFVNVSMSLSSISCSLSPSLIITHLVGVFVFCWLLRSSTA